MVLLSSPNKKFVHSRSFLNFFKDFCKLKEQFLRIWENFAPHPGIRPSLLDKKNCPGGRDSLAQKNFPLGCSGDVSSWN